MEAWKSVIDADLKAAEYTGGTPIPDGVYPATLSNVEVKKFNAGSKGLQVTYTLQGEGDLKGRTIRDYIVVERLDGTTDVRGVAMVKKLLIEGGLTLEEIKKFKYPEPGSNSFGDFKKLLDQPYTVDIKARENKKGPNAGQKFSRVQTFRQRAA